MSAILRRAFRVALPPLNFTTSRTAHLELANADDFRTKVLKNPKPVVVNFHGDWCEPCQILSPALRKMLKDDNNVDLLIINVDDNADLVHTFEVKAVPAVLCFKNGVVVDKFIGLVDINVLENVIKKLTELE